MTDSQINYSNLLTNWDYFQSQLKMAGQFVRLCLDGGLVAVRAALRDGVDVNTADGDGWLGLFWALTSRHSAVASVLLAEEGIDVNFVGEFGTTALHLAAEGNRECLAKMLAQTDLTTVNQRDSDGCTPLRWAVDRNAAHQ